MLEKVKHQKSKFDLRFLTPCFLHSTYSYWGAVVGVWSTSGGTPAWPRAAAEEPGTQARTVQASLAALAGGKEKVRRGWGFAGGEGAVCGVWQRGRQALLRVTLVQRLGEVGTAVQRPGKGRFCRGSLVVKPLVSGTF